MSYMYAYLDENVWKPTTIINIFVLACTLADVIMLILNHFVIHSLIIDVYLFGFILPVFILAITSLIMTIHNKRVVRDIRA